MREHLEAYEERAGFPHPMLLDAPALPATCGQLWRDFTELHSCRGRGMSPMPISPRDIIDWQELNGVRLASWEVDAIRAADGAYFEAVA